VGFERRPREFRLGLRLAVEPELGKNDVSKDASRPDKHCDEADNAYCFCVSVTCPNQAPVNEPRSKMGAQSDERQAHEQENERHE
jgi:hypothetical protein